MSARKKIKSSHDGRYHFIKLLRNWLHQGLTYMDSGEMWIRLIAETGEIILIFYLLHISAFESHLDTWVLLLIAATMAHTANWVINGNFWALYLFAVPGAKNRGEATTVIYLNRMKERLSRNASITGLAIYGSIARSRWHNASDIDIRIVRGPGLLNLVAAATVSMRERLYAFLSKQPLDLFLADDMDFLRKMREDEQPIFLIKQDPRLDNEYPGIPDCALTNLEPTTTTNSAVYRG